ncbi:uncharacterized protein G2W53_024897 [Senna tora]|uniref:Uncharacterized protein n=1 Tax=Senna tora TaxID=362788 RepID=A0A834WE89_9FABA|nr:uncharacterized protein G2W53_024897 [Senna tora]
MGSCSSVHRNSETEMKLGLAFGSKTGNLVIPPSPVKDQKKHNNNGNFRIGDIALNSHWSPSRSTNTTFRDYGSKEETFFDSKPWLDSDCEDDFYSVNGEFTPSRGNTPVHHSFKTPSENRSPGPMPGPSPTTEKKKKLLELFRESVRDNHYGDDGNTFSDVQNLVNGNKDVKQASINVPLPKSARSTPYNNMSGTNSVCSSTERTINGGNDSESFREKSMKSMQGCLPSLVSCRSFRERKRKMSPAVAANGKALTPLGV